MKTFEQAFHAAVTIPGERIVPPSEESRAVFDWTVEYLEGLEEDDKKSFEEMVEEKDDEISELSQDLALAEKFIKMLGVEYEVHGE